MLSSAPVYPPVLASGGIEPLDTLGLDAPESYIVDVVDRSLNQDFTQRFGQLPFSSLEWTRIRNDFSTCTLTVPRGLDDRRLVSGGLRPWRNSIRVIRNGRLEWGGPVTRIEVGPTSYQVSAIDWVGHMRKKLLQQDIRIEPGGTKIVEVNGLFNAQSWLSEPLGPWLDRAIDQAWDLDEPAIQPPKPFYGLQYTVGFQEVFEWTFNSLRTLYDLFSESGIAGRWSTAGAEFFTSQTEAAFNWQGRSITDPGLTHIGRDWFERDTFTWAMDGTEMSNEWFRVPPEDGDQTYGTTSAIEAFSWSDLGLTNPGTVAGGGAGRMQKGVTGETAWPDYVEDPIDGCGITVPSVTIDSGVLVQGCPLGMSDLIPHRLFTFAPPAGFVDITGVEYVVTALDGVNVSVEATEEGLSESVSTSFGKPL